MKLGTLAAGVVAACATVLAGCVTTSMQGYADLDRPARPVEHIAVVAPPALVAVLAAEWSKRGLIIEDGNVIVPPTRQYKDAEIRQLLAARGVDGVLVVSVTGDSGVQERYAGTIFSGNYSGTSSGNCHCHRQHDFWVRDLLRHHERYGDADVPVQPNHSISGTPLRSEIGAQSLGRRRSNARGRGSVHGRRDQRSGCRICHSQ